MMDNSMGHYRRSLEELRKVASMFWSKELSQQAAKLSIIPILLETQDKFITILSVEVENIDGLFGVLAASTMPANIFLKHLVILSDFSGEMLQRINKEFAMFFPEGKLEYLWNGEIRHYEFSQLPISGKLDNKRLSISGKKLSSLVPLSELYKDVIALLLLGSASTDEYTADILSKCEIRDYIGNPDQLGKFIKQRYIWVSRITNGSESNNLGKIAEKFVQEYIEEHLGIIDVDIKATGHIPGVTHTHQNDIRDTTFDLVVSKDNRYIGIEISFQVTTNSVIERKSGQALSRFNQIEQGGHKIAYVLDGAGNFARKPALETILQHSHCSVALSISELDILCQFIRENLIG